MGESLLGFYGFQRGSQHITQTTACKKLLVYRSSPGYRWADRVVCFFFAHTYRRNTSMIGQILPSSAIHAGPGSCHLSLCSPARSSLLWAQGYRTNMQIHPWIRDGTDTGPTQSGLYLTRVFSGALQTSVPVSSWT